MGTNEGPLQVASWVWPDGALKLVLGSGFRIDHRSLAVAAGGAYAETNLLIVGLQVPSQRRVTIAGGWEQGLALVREMAEIACQEHAPGW